MAAVNKRPSGKWQATVRKNGMLQSKSFSKRVRAPQCASTKGCRNRMQAKCSTVQDASHTLRISVARPSSDARFNPFRT
jgi:hypothetical protein